MDNAQKHWSILRKLGTELANKVRSFMVIRKRGKTVMVVTENGEGYWLGEMKFGLSGTIQTMKPTRLDVPNLVSMAQGHRHILLLDKSGQIHAMGENYRGQLGLGTVGKKTYFIPQLIPIPHKFISVRCGFAHSVALTEDGNVWAWGLNDFGQVGLPGSTDIFPSPRQLPELDPHRVVAVECGSNHSLAMTKQGEIYAWGRNDWGQLGNGSKSFQHTPIRIPIPSPVQSMAAGYGHTLLLTKSGEVYACGDNEFGQLGLPTTTESNSHLFKVAGLPHISQIQSHPHTNLSIAMSSEQLCFVWGELRDDTPIFTPRKLPPVYSTVESPLSSFSFHCSTLHSVNLSAKEFSCRTDLTMQMELCSDIVSSNSLPANNRLLDRICQMFDNPDSNPDVRFKVKNQFILAHQSVLQIFSGHFSQLFSSCSANPSRIQAIPNQSKLDANSTPSSPHSSQITIYILDHSYPAFHAYLRFLYLGTLEVSLEHLADLFSLSVAYHESDLQQLCLWRMRTTLTTTTCCLYYPLTHRHFLPELATFQQELVQFISTRTSEVYRSAAYCAMDSKMRSSLVSIKQTSQQQTKMDNAQQHWSILRKLKTELANKIRAFIVIGEDGDGVVMTNKDRQGFWLGKMEFEWDEWFEMSESKEAMEPTRLDVPNLASMAQGKRHILLLDESGQIYAMGRNDQGQLGLGTVDEVTHFLPQLIPILHKFISVRCGHRHSLALTEDGKVWAWGWNVFEQVGVSRLTAITLPTLHQISELNPHRIVAIECGGHHSLALTDQGEVYGWGNNGSGQLGDWSKSSTHTPTRIPTLSPVQSMAAGENHTLLLTQTGEVYACGKNEFGQLGLPTTTESNPYLFKIAGLPPIAQIASHPATNLSIAMSSEQRCFVWGELRDETTISTPRELSPEYSTVESPLSFYSTYRSTPHSVTLPAKECLRETVLTNLTKPCSDIVSGQTSLAHNRLLDRISQMFNNPNSSPDVRFQVENQSILAHRSMLQISSGHFRQLFSSFSAYPSCSQTTANQSKPDANFTPSSPHSSQITISIPDQSYPVFYAYLRFLYLGILEVAPEHLADLFSLSVAYLESDLRQLCLSRMRTTLTPATCCLYYPLTHRHSQLPELATFQQELIQFASTKFFEVIATAAYREMDGELSKSLTIAITELHQS